MVQFEHKIITQRQKEGIDIEKIEGKFKGCKTKLIEECKEEQRMKAITEAYKKGKSINDIRTTFKVIAETIYRVLEREGIR